MQWLILGISFIPTLAQSIGSYTVVKDNMSMSDFDAVYPDNLDSLQSFQKFVSIVEENKMNVSLILSRKNYYKTGQQQLVFTVILDLMPANKHYLTNSDLKKADVDEMFFIGKINKLTVVSRRVVADGTPLKIELRQNNLKEHLSGRGYDLLTHIKNGKTGFQFDEDTYIAKYTFLTPSDEMKMKTTKVLFSSKNRIDVLQSYNMNMNELNYLKSVVDQIRYMYEGFDIPKMIVVYMDQRFPGNNWQVAVSSGEDDFLDSEKFAKIQIQDEVYTIFSID